MLVDSTGRHGPNGNAVGWTAKIPNADVGRWRWGESLGEVCRVCSAFVLTTSFLGTSDVRSYQSYSNAKSAKNGLAREERAAAENLGGGDRLRVSCLQDEGEGEAKFVSMS